MSDDDNEKAVNNEDTDGLGMSLVALVVIVVGGMYRAWVAAMLWAWFAEPLTGVAILPAQMFGLHLLWAVHRNMPEPKRDPTWARKAVATVSRVTITWTILLCVGWTVLLAGGL